MKTYFLLIDTNIYVRVLSQGKPGCEVEAWNELISLVQNKKVTLLYPEVVNLELHKQWRTLPLAIEKNIIKLRASLEKHLHGEIAYSEIKDLGKSLLENLDTKSKEKLDSLIDHYTLLTETLNSDLVTGIPLSLDILLEGKKRSIRGGLADPDRKSDGDSLIVESLVSFFRDNPCASSYLLICTENISDFGLRLNESGPDEKSVVLHPAIASDLPTAELFTDIRSLNKFLNSERTPRSNPTEAGIHKGLTDERVARLTKEIWMDEKLGEVFGKSEGLLRDLEFNNQLNMPRLGLSISELFESLISPEDKLAIQRFQTEIDESYSTSALKSLQEEISRLYSDSGLQDMQRYTDALTPEFKDFIDQLKKQADLLETPARSGSGIADSGDSENAMKKTRNNP
jgi:hypothetical protein